MNERVIDAIEGTLKDWGVDWILEERGNINSFKNLMYELKLAVKGVID